MKNFFKIVGIILMVAIIGFGFITCVDETCTACDGTSTNAAQCTNCMFNPGKCPACGGDGSIY